MMHYKRERSGKPLADERPERGAPDGHGLYGVLDDDGDTVGCHECGERKASLGPHVLSVHGMSARAYKLAHGLPLSRGLVSTAEREQRSDLARARIGTPGWRALEAARDPQAAADARDAESFASMARLVAPARAIANGRAARRHTVRECPVDRTQWCPLPGGYRRITCSDECWSTWQAWCTASHQPKNAARDARIYADVARRGLDAGEVGARYGLGRERVTQIVRQRACQDPGPEPDPRPDDALPASELDAWWVERADAVGAYYDLNGNLPYTPHPDHDIDALAWWLHHQTQGARTPATTRRERYRRAYLERVAPTWDPTAYPQARPDRTTSSSTP